MTPQPGLPTGDPLAGLRAYHLPEPPSWWPPAPGWWVLAALIVLGALLVLLYLRRRRRCRGAARQAMYELQQLRRGWRQHADGAASARALSRLLRRFAMAAFPRRDVAALTGERWLRFLDQQGGQGRFVDGPGRWLIEAPYRPAMPGSVDEVATLVEDWIRHNQDVCR